MEEVCIAQSIDVDPRLLISLRGNVPPPFFFLFFYIFSFHSYLIHSFCLFLFWLDWYSLRLIRMAVSIRGNCSEQKSGTLVRPLIIIYFLTRASLRKCWRCHYLEVANVSFFSKLMAAVYARTLLTFLLFSVLRSSKYVTEARIYTIFHKITYTTMF